MAGGPQFAVIVSAHGRREYLREAVRSVRAQTVPRDRVELVVSKDFEDPDLDRELAAAGAKLLLDPEGRVGRKHWRAMETTTAPWVSFLDDDDAFEPERLARIAEVVRDHPDLGFYRNRVRVIDRLGAPTPIDRWREHEVDRGFDRIGPVYLPSDGKARAFELGVRETFATFNSSSITFRRELLAGDLAGVYQRSAMVDTVLFLAAVIGPFGLFLDDRRLTRFRFTGSSRTAESRWFDLAVSSEAEMADAADRHGLAEFARYFRGLSVHYGRMLRGSTIAAEIARGADRAGVARQALDYLRFLGEHPAERRWTVDTWAAGLYGLGYAVAPGAVRRLAAARITAGRT